MYKIIMGKRRSGKTTWLLRSALNVLLTIGGEQIFFCFQPERVVMMGKDMLVAKGITGFSVNISLKEITTKEGRIKFMTPDEDMLRGAHPPVRVTYDLNWPIAKFPFHKADVFMSMEDDWEIERLESPDLDLEK